MQGTHSSLCGITGEYIYPPANWGCIKNYKSRALYENSHDQNLLRKQVAKELGWKYVHTSENNLDMYKP